MPTEGMVTCPICGKDLKTLNLHVQRFHKIAMPDFRAQYPGQPIHGDAFKADIGAAHSKPRKFVPNYDSGTKGVPFLDPIADAIRACLEEYKIMAIYWKMSVKEYNIRREAFKDFRTRMGEPEVLTMGWGRMIDLLKAKDPLLKVPPAIAKLAYKQKRKPNV